MIRHLATADSRRGHARQRGFTLIELTVAVAIVGVMAALSLPSFQKAIQQSRADVAGANLRAIWAAQRVYWLEYHAYTDQLDAQSPWSAASLVDIGLLDPGLFTSGNYTYAVTSATTDAFTITATSPNGLIVLKITETGTIAATGVTLGFQ